MERDGSCAALALEEAVREGVQLAAAVAAVAAAVAPGTALHSPDTPVLRSIVAAPQLVASSGSSSVNVCVCASMPPCYLQLVPRQGSSKPLTEFCWAVLAVLAARLILKAGNSSGGGTADSCCAAYCTAVRAARLLPEAASL